MATIENPILRGFSPDPSIARVGDDYFVATSTFEWFPGVRLHHSRDLVHWRELGGALTSRALLELSGIPDSGGVWAPALSYADGQFWLVYTVVRTCGLGRPFKDLCIYLVTAPGIAGPWSEPVELNSPGFDPSLFHDSDGRKWLVNMEWDHRQTGVRRFAGIVVQEYDPVRRTLVGAQTKILQKPILCEGPNLYRRGGWYYLMLAEGGTSWNHGIAMARARQITGPYELDPQPTLLTTSDAPDSPLQKAGHGELVETPGGEWYLAHLASRPIGEGSQRRCILGRETCLQKVRWTEDGWLRLAPATSAMKPWHPARVVPPPAGVAAHPWPAEPARDDFDGAELGRAWSTLRTPPDPSWLSLTARPGWLRLRGRESLHSLFRQSLVARPLRSVRTVAETCMEFEPGVFGEMAGLVAYYDTRTFYYLRVTHDETVGRVVGVVECDDGAYRELTATNRAINDWRRVHLRATFNEASLQFAASRDGDDWLPIGPVLDASKLSDDYGSALHFTGAMAGLCVQDLGSHRATADFDYFAIEEK